MDSCIDFDTGKLTAVGKTNCRAEYALLGFVLLITVIPYVVLFWLKPLVGLGVVSTVIIFKMVAAFASSAGTGLSHHVRFLLSGSNPLGMSGGASLLLGAVDSIFDWREDAAYRRRSPLRFWWTTALKFATTPLGIVAMALEFLWDLALLRRSPRLLRCKWQEFFSLARYHSLICPEKSNDIFYADMAFARYRDNVFLYQWNRMRSMVFELQHYRMDIESGVGSAQSNLFRVGDIAAYQSLKRLEIERIENALQRHFQDHPEDFPIPAKIASRLVANARPLAQYLRMGNELLARDLLPAAESAHETALRSLIPRRLIWHVLRLLDQAPFPITGETSRHIGQQDLVQLVDAGILVSDLTGYRFGQKFLAEFERLLETHFTVATEEQGQTALRSKVPVMIDYRGVSYLPKRLGAYQSPA